MSDDLKGARCVDCAFYAEIPGELGDNAYGYCAEDGEWHCGEDIASEVECGRFRRKWL